MTERIGNDAIQLTGSKHFVLQELSEGIFAAIARTGGSAICNSGLIDLGGQILAFDTFLTPQAAMDLRQQSIELLGHPPNLVVNSHYHNDHIWGNQVFLPDAKILSSTRTRDLIATAGMEEFRWYSANSAQRLGSLRAQDQHAGDEQQLWIGYYEGLVEALPRLAVCLPAITFDSRMEIHGSRYTAELITFEGAHTGSDTVLYLPSEGIVFMSDLLFVGFHPYLGDGNPHQLLKALRELGQLKATRFVSGHGPVGTVDDLRLMIEYIDYCLETARSLVENGHADDEHIANLKIAETFRDLQVPRFFQANIRFICERTAKAQA